MAGVLRLSYFDVFGVDSNGTYAGITIDNSPIVVSAVFFLESFIDHNAFVAILYAAILVMAFLHVAPFRTGKLGRVWYYVFTTYVVMATGGYSYILGSRGWSKPLGISRVSEVPSPPVQASSL